MKMVWLRPGVFFSYPKVLLLSYLAKLHKETLLLLDLVGFPVWLQSSSS
jgi:hypothetical protein